MNPVTLADGTVVDSSSEAWRAETEARAVLNMRDKNQRRAYLHGVIGLDGRVLEKGCLQYRGAEATARLEAHVMRLWKYQKDGVWPSR